MLDRRAGIRDSGHRARLPCPLVRVQVLISAVWSRLDANYQLTFASQGQPVSQDTLPASDWLLDTVRPSDWLMCLGWTLLGTCHPRPDHSGVQGGVSVMLSWAWHMTKSWPMSRSLITGVTRVTCPQWGDMMTMATAPGSMSPMFPALILIISWQQEDGDQSSVTTGVTRVSWHSSQVVTKTLAALHSYR